MNISEAIVYGLLIIFGIPAIVAVSLAINTDFWEKLAASLGKKK